MRHPDAMPVEPGQKFGGQTRRSLSKRLSKIRTRLSGSPKIRRVTKRSAIALVTLGMFGGLISGYAYENRSVTEQMTICNWQLGQPYNKWSDAYTDGTVYKINGMIDGQRVRLDMADSGLLSQHYTAGDAIFARLGHTAEGQGLYSVTHSGGFGWWDVKITDVRRLNSDSTPCVDPDMRYGTRLSD
jgi:hypothetical protein